MPQSVIKPKTQNFKRNPSPKAKTSGFKDYLAIAQALDITTRPTRPDFTATMEAKEYATAIAATPATAFGATAVWGKLEIEEGTLKVMRKPIGKLQETTGKVTEITFEVADTEEMQGYLDLIAAAPLDVIIEKNNGSFIWFGDADRGVYLDDVSTENTTEKGRIAVKLTFRVLTGLYLPSGTTISYVTA